MSGSLQISGARSYLIPVLKYISLQNAIEHLSKKVPLKLLLASKPVVAGQIYCTVTAFSLSAVWY